MPSFDEITALYNEHDDAPAARRFVERVADRLVDQWALWWSPGSRRRGEPRESGRGRRLLSIGCGYALPLQKYIDRGWQVFGVDTSPQAIAWNREHINGEFTLGTFEEAEFGATFDVIHCSAVIEHVDDPVAFLSRARSLLAPGGKLLFFTPNGGSAATRWMKRYSVATWVPFHVVLFTPEGLRKAAELAGLDAEVHSIAEPHLASLSIRQWRHRDARSFTLEKGWDTRLTTLLLAPVWAALNQLSMGEELALIALERNPDASLSASSVDRTTGLESLGRRRR